jgi:CshA-type fibril repeat protein/VCBS repeat-containing protein
LNPSLVGIQNTYTVANEGTYTVDALGVVTFTPVSNFNGTTTSINYTVNDNLGLVSNIATLTITVSPINDAPVANDDTVALALTEDGANGTVNVLTNDTDNDGNPTVSSGHVVDLDPSTPAIETTFVDTEGTWTYDTVTGVVTFDPALNFNGPASIPYTLCDAGTPILCDTAVITFSVEAVNDAPVVNDDTATTPEDIAVIIDVTDNDSDLEGSIDATSVVVTVPPTNGTTSVDSTTGEVTYTPNLGYSGLDSFTYQVCDSGLPLPAVCDTAVVYLTITSVNDAPIIVDDTNVTNEDTPVTGDISTVDDFDPDGTALVVNTTPVNGPANGTIVIQPDGTYVYTPNPNFNGTDVITIEVCDSGTPLPAICDNQTLTITVNPINDTPVANNDLVSTPEDTDVVITVLNNDTSLDGALVPSTVAITVIPTNGITAINPLTGAITYTPNLGFNGIDTFTYQVCDDGTPLPALCDTAVVTVLVAPINDVPVILPDTNVTNEDTPVTGDITNSADFDPDGTTLVVTTTPVDGPDNGTIVIQPDGTYVYTPDPNFNGVDTVLITVCDSGIPLAANCVNQLLTITVNPVNDAPIAINDVATTAEDIAVVIPVISNDSDLEGPIDPASVTITFPPSNGTTSINTLTGEVTYTPNPGYNGMDEFTYQVCDSGTPLPAQCVTGIVSLTVTAVNDAPVIVDDINVTNEDTPVSGDVTNAADFDSDGTTLVANSTPVSGPSNGAIIIQPDGTYIYTPNTNFNGIDVVTIEVCDSGNPLPAICENQTLTITVNPVNDAPIVDNDVATTNEDTPAIGDLTDSGDSDPDGTPLLVTTTPIDGPNNGTIVINPDGTYEYTPNPNFNGTDVITVQICDSGTPLPASCVNQTLTITVVPVNDEPKANDDTVVLALVEDSANGTVNIFTNDTDIDGNPTPTSGHTVDLNPTLVGNQSLLTDAQGTWTFDTTTGVLTFDPALNFNGPASIPYTLCDAGTPILCDDAIISFNVTAVNDAPKVDNDNNTINEDTLATGDLTDSGDSDPDGTPLLVTTTPVIAPINGTIVINPDGTYVYTPKPNFNGTDVITVEVCDSGIPLPASCVNQTLTITVVPVNDAPIANDDTVALALIEDAANGTVNIFTNDTDIDGNPTPTSGHTVDLNPTLVGNQSLLTDAQGTWTFDTTTGVLTFDPALNFNGPASIPYTLCDAGTPILCDDAIIRFNVTSVNDAPVANNDVATTTEDTPVTINVITNSVGPDSDVDGTINLASVDLNLSLLGVQTTFTVPSEGDYSVDGLGNVTFTPNANFIGVTTPINYTVKDNEGLVSNIATLTITVVKSNDAPVANDDIVALALTEDGVNGTVNLLTNDTDVDGYPSVTSGHTVDLDPSTSGIDTTFVDAEGIWTYNPSTGFVTFDPADNFNGVASTQYQLCDSGLPVLCDSAIIQFTVTPVNDIPVANNDSGITLSETPIKIAIINNTVLSGQDTDIEGNNTIVLSSIDLNPNIPGLQQSLVVPGEGTYTANAEGELTFVPVPSALGFTSIIVYTIYDDKGAVSNVASVTIEVGACVDNPVLDCDDDGLTNAEEKTNRTDPTNPDTDGDGVIDGTEIVDGTKPLLPCDSIEEHVTVEQSIAFKAGDCDDDGLPNGNEIGPDPTNPLDSNGNGTLDYLEPNNHNQSNSEDGIEIFSGVSPDGGDVLNAVFTIRNIELYPSNTVEIYNRWGVLVYETAGYGQNGKYFRGDSEGRVTVSKAEKLPEATYFYILKYTKPTGETKERSGYLYINR